LPSTHGIVSDIRRDVRTIPKVQRDVKGTHTMLSDVHRTMAKGQEDGDGINLLVSETRTVPIAE